MHVQPVYVVEDSEDIRQILRILLEDAGYAVDEAADGTAGLALIRSANLPAIVLLDLMLPGLKGNEILAILDQEGSAAQHAYIVLTARRFGSLSELTGVANRLDVRVLAKPFDLDDLLGAVAMAAEALSARQEAKPR